MPSLTAILVLATMGCGSPDEATPELDAVAQTLFREFEDSSAVTQALEDLSVLLAEVDLEADTDARSFTLEPLTDTDVGETAIDEQDPTLCSAVALTYQSPWSPADHSSYQVLEDLSVLGTASSYEREFLEPDDPSCFPAGSCELLRTQNTIVRESFLFTLSSSMRKDYRWVETGAGAAMLERGWLTESAHGEAGSNHVWQTFEIEVWLPREDGSVRFYAQYAEADYAGVSDALARSLALSGAQNAMEAADAYLEETTD
ncbi:MAG: hypothetical protein QGG40_05755 [Myxococcota bacterium]|jgi:hypothetical protein|nr:hypothetical protein [Myxococcota bacterium]